MGCEIKIAENLFSRGKIVREFVAGEKKKAKTHFTYELGRRVEGISSDEGGKQLITELRRVGTYIFCSVL